jgi:hypothetical protein
MPKIKIHRKREWTLKLGSSRTSIFEVFLDGQRIGYLPKGESIEHDVTTGEHKLRVKAGWFGSREHHFNIFGKETKSFTVSSINNYTVISAIILVILIEFLRISHWQKKLIHIILSVIVAAAIGFYILGRNSYIIIREKSDN